MIPPPSLLSHSLREGSHRLPHNGRWWRTGGRPGPGTRCCALQTGVNQVSLRHIWAPSSYVCVISSVIMTSSVHRSTHSPTHMLLTGHSQNSSRLRWRRDLLRSWEGRECLCSTWDSTILHQSLPCCHHIWMGFEVFYPQEGVKTEGEGTVWMMRWGLGHMYPWVCPP